MIVSHSWLAEHYNDPDLIILDSRGSVAYSYAHIPRSQPLGVDKVIKATDSGANLVLEPENAASLFSSLGIDETKTVIIYGDYMDPSAARISWTLLYYGHEKTKILDIGIRSWYQKGLAITKEVYKPNPAIFVPKVNSAIRIGVEELQKRIDSAFIIDARSPQEYMGGKIPNSVLFPFTDGVGEKGSLFKEKDELVKIFEVQKIPKDKELVCYCALGHRAANVFTQLKIAGYENVRLYDGSLADWIGRRLPLG